MSFDFDEDVLASHVYQSMASSLLRRNILEDRKNPPDTR